MTAILPPNYYTLRFNSYNEAKAVCQQLGYWREATEDIPEGPITDGQIVGPDGVRGFSIAEIGQDPVLPDGTQLQGYYVNVAGLLPAAAEAYQVEYGSAGLRFQEGPPAPPPARSVRARNPDGTFRADDPATPDIDEAYEP